MPDIQIDPRGPRFGAAVTLTGAVVALVIGDAWPGVAIMAILAVLYVPGAIRGPQATLQGAFFKAFVRPRLSPPAQTESFRPPRFAQQLGLFFTTAAVACALAGWSLGFLIFVGFLTFASALQAVFGLCLGCEMYLLFRRATARAA
ncbi:DUF4395 domain-containing protein [Demequina pelophila]|uniref:DUF4395 domain-containing protein n=1 Tax=Demequina pelophila TaxID=1638984 RepID=UPI00078487D1|nr:DUF4395 domain-containing protein [Demequina pelophila]